MTNIGYFRAASKLLEVFSKESGGTLSISMWVIPPTKNG
jgi:aconitase B